MHLFDSMRRYSRNSSTTASKRPTQPAPIPAVPNPSVISTARQPLLPHTNLNFNSSQSSLISEDSVAGSSGQSGSQKYGGVRGRDDHESSMLSKAPSTKTTRSERSNTVNSLRDGNSTTMPTGGIQSSPQRSTYAQHSDLYTHNALNSFSFGAAQSGFSSPRSIDPLSPNRDDADSDELYKADTTPRPSLVGNHSPPSHHSHMLSMPDLAPTPLPPPPRSSASAKAVAQRARRNSNASAHTFGTSSASASVTSLSSTGITSTTTSRRGALTTPQTSANELTSEDEEAEHRHPIPASFAHGTTYNSSLYGSDDDEDFDDDSDLDRDYEPDIDISSEFHEDPDHAPFYEFNNTTHDSFQSAFPPRRGSLAVPIPSPSAVDPHGREDCLTTLRRPSRSLEGLKSSSLTETHSNSSRHFDDRPLPPAPTSVPESEGDWRDLRRRSIQKEKDNGARQSTAPPVPSKLSISAANTPSVQEQLIAPSSSTGTLHNPVLDGFDASWNINPATGIVDLEWDQSEMADIVGGFQGPRSSERSFRRGSASTTDSGRRLSTTSTNSDPFTRGLNKWGGQQYLDERMKWTFVREKADRLEENRAGVERERNSISNLFHPRSSFSPASSMIGSSAGFTDPDLGSSARERDKASSKEKERVKDSAPWRGMAIDAEEWWSSYSNGRYRVVRKSMAANQPGKPSQQRLNISHHRTPYSLKRDLSDGPSITIHKHSKAVGFSISRHYRPKPSSGASSGRASTSSRAPAAPVVAADKKKSSNMILLAARKVQEAYTSTTTTRMLESHGLLSENGQQSSRDLERLERLEREKREGRKKETEKEKQRQKELKKAAQDAAKGKDKSKSRAQQLSTTDGNTASSSESSTGSVDNNMAASAKSSSLASHAHRPSADYSVRSQETSSSDRTIVWSAQQRRRYDDVIEEDDEYDEERKPPSRTPHPETYATLPAEAFETFALQQENHSHSIFPWSKSRGNSVLQRHIEKSYNPPWAVAQARFHDRKGIVEDLNTSFQDVGLLPAVDEMKSSSSLPHKRKRHPHGDPKRPSKSSNDESPNVFHCFSAEYLYMLLPLWPGETDQNSVKKFPFDVPHIPIESRQYLLMYYKPEETQAPVDADKNKVQREGKKRLRTSPTSSRDSSHKQEKSILYDKFHFCARVVSYSEIQGSGVRSPDVGLSVLGPLNEAYETMPKCSLIDTFQVIGLCQSREKGIEFVPEGLEKLGLTRRVVDPSVTKEEMDPKRSSIASIEEQDEVSDTMLLLTPIGRAVVEMAWLGAMALASFGPVS